MNEIKEKSPRKDDTEFVDTDKDDTDFVMAFYGQGKATGFAAGNSFCGRCKAELPYSSPSGYEWEHLDFCWFCSHREQYVWVQLPYYYLEEEGEVEVV